MENSEIIKFIFGDSKTIKNTKHSWKFLNQIINADTKNFKLDVDSDYDLYIWEGGEWKNGIWEDGDWYDGIWKNGIWKEGFIYNPKTQEYEPSGKPPNECTWSLSYER